MIHFMYWICGDMLNWIEEAIGLDKRLDLKRREAYLVTLRWYLGYCAKRQWSPVEDRNFGRQFWREVVAKRSPEDWKKDQWTDALKWFFDLVEKRDDAGRAMRLSLRRRHVAYRTEIAYMNWLRRFQAYLRDGDAMEAFGGTRMASPQESRSSFRDRRRNRAESSSDKYCCPFPVHRLLRFARIILSELNNKIPIV